ncbi:MAG: hypothetical protein WC756_03500 [Taibaiella sp.]|jgi:hypothetical protein
MKLIKKNIYGVCIIIIGCTSTKHYTTRYYNNDSKIIYGRYYNDSLDFSLDEYYDFNVNGNIENIRHLKCEDKDQKRILAYKSKETYPLFFSKQINGNNTHIGIAYNSPNNINLFTQQLYLFLKAKIQPNFIHIDTLKERSGFRLTYEYKVRSKSIYECEYIFPIKDKILRLIFSNKDLISHNYSSYEEQEFIVQSNATTLMETFKDSVHYKAYNIASLSPLYFAQTLFENSNFNYLQTLKVLNAAYSIKQKVDPFFYQALSTYTSFTGDYLQKLKWDSTYQEPQPSIPIDTFINLKPTNALAYLSERCKFSKIVLLNEDHTNPQCRIFAASLLDSLYENGYRQLGVETLSWLDTAINERRFPLQISGVYSSEPMFGEFLRQALKKGFRLFNYENIYGCDSSDQFYCRQQREVVQAQNILAVQRQNPNDKILIYAGWGHIKKQKSVTSGFKYLGAILADSIGSDQLLSIDQTVLSEQGNSVSETSCYKYAAYELDIQSPSVLLQDGEPFISNKENKGNIDVEVITPRTKYVNNKPTWLLYSGNLTIKPDTNRIFNDALLQIFYFDEVFNAFDYSKAVPFLNLHLVHEAIPELKVNKGKYMMLVTDEYRNKLLQQIITAQ